MPNLSEHRLIHRTLREENALRQRAGASDAAPVSEPLSTRQVQQQVQYQDQQRANNLQGVSAPTAVDGVQSQGTPVYLGATAENPKGSGEISHYNNDGKTTATPYQFGGVPGAGNTQTNQYQQPYQDPRNPTGAAPPPGAKVGDERNMFPSGTEAKPNGYRQPKQIDQNLPPEMRAALEQENAAIEARNTELMKQQKTQQEGQKAKEAPTQEAPPTAPGQSAVTMMLRGMGPEGQAIAEAMEKQNAENARTQAEAQTLQTDLLNKSETAFNDVKKQLEQMKLDAVSNGDAVKELLKEVSDDNQEYIAQQQKAADERLQWEATKQQRTLAKQKVDQRESMIVQSALFGGFGQDARIREINESDESFESAIRNVQTELGYARTDLAVKFTGMYLENKNKYREGLIANLKDVQTQLTNLAFQDIGNTQAKASAEQTILQNGWNNMSTLRKEAAANNLATVKEMTQMVKEEKAIKRAEDQQKKTDASAFFQFAFTQSTDPKLRQIAIDRMKGAGYEMPEGIDINADPISFQLASMNNEAKAEKSTASDPFRFTGESAAEQQALAASALTVAGQLEGGVDMNWAQVKYVNQLLDRGQVEEARAHLRGLAVASLKGAQETLYSDRNTIVSSGNELLSSLKEIKDSSKGQTMLKGLQEAGALLAGKSKDELTADDFTQYSNKVNKLKTSLGAEGDEKLMRVFAKIENIAGIIISQRFGAAVTDGEFDRARQYIAMSGNTLSEIIIKTEEFSKFSKMQNESMLNTKMGIADSEADLYAPDVNSSPAIPADNDFNNMFQPDGGGGMSMNVTLPKENGKLTTPFVSGIVTGYGSKYWEAGVDISAPRGSPVNNAKQGTVTKVVYDPNWKGTPNNPKAGMAQNGGFGNQVEVKYGDGVRLSFSHGEKVLVKQGQTLEPGVPIMTVGNTGNTYGPTGVHVDVTGYRPDGTRMTAKEVAAYMQSGDLVAASSYRS